MELPNSHAAIVEREKIVEYLLNAAHPDNGGKAAFFTSHGFTGNDWQNLAAALRKLGQSATVIKRLETPHGFKYVTDGQIEAPDGRAPRIRAIWIIDRGFDVPRLVTAYPQDE